MYININVIFVICVLFLVMVDVKSESASTELQDRLESNKQELDRFLGVYPYDRFLFLLCLGIHFADLKLAAFQ